MNTLTDYRYIELRQELTRIAAKLRSLTEEVGRVAVIADELERDNQPDITGTNPTKE